MCFSQAADKRQRACVQASQPHCREDPTVCHFGQSVSKDLCTRAQRKSLQAEVTEGARTSRLKAQQGKKKNSTQLKIS